MEIKIKSEDGYKLYASASDILHTATSSKTGAVELTISSDNSTTAQVRYLTTPSSNKRFDNSVAIEIKWQNGNRQEVILAVPAGKINSIVWRYGTQTITTSASYVTVANKGLITVKANISGTSNVSHGKLSYLSLYGYYVSKQGYIYEGNGVVTNSDPKVGSWNYPGKARHRATSAANYGNWLNKPFFKDFDFTPPTDQPNYYIMMAYKGWMAGVGHIDVLEGGENHFQDISSYWDAGYKEKIRYSFYAVYSDAVIPGIDGDAARANSMRTGTNRDEADTHAMWVQFVPPPDLYDISWVRNSNKSIYLKDGNNRDLKYCAVNKTAIRTPNWEINDANWDRTKEHFKAWHVKEGSSGSWSAGVASVEGKKVNGKSLSFALELESNTYKITYNDDTGATKEYPNIPHGTQITIKPQGNLPQTVVKHIDPSRTLHENVSSYPYNVTSSFILNSPTTTLDWTFVGWSRSGNTFTAVWRPNNINITYNANNGTSQQAFYSIVYGGSHTWKTPSACNFTPPIDKPIFLYWTTNRDGTGERYYPGNSKAIRNNTGSLTVWGQWGSPWKKVEWIWVYEPDKPDGTKDDHGWKRHKPWINTR